MLLPDLTDSGRNSTGVSDAGVWATPPASNGRDHQQCHGLWFVAVTRRRASAPWPRSPVEAEALQLCLCDERNLSDPSRPDDASNRSIGL
jgi:hypothetical protein